jgi:hypothetical protein
MDSYRSNCYSSNRQEKNNRTSNFSLPVIIVIVLGRNSSLPDLINSSLLLLPLLSSVFLKNKESLEMEFPSF